jgi:hypothetical protein
MMCLVYISLLVLVLVSEIGTSCVHWVQLSRFHLKTETESSLQNVVCLK